MLAAGIVMATGCAPGPRPVADAVPESLPVIRVEEVVGSGVDEAREPVLTREPGGGRVTLTATGAELASVLAVLADAAGVSLVVAPEVRSRVTVHLEDVPAEEALRRLIVETGLAARRRLEPPWGPTIFFVAPVNVNEADAATIRARFDVSAELARFLVQSRIPD